MTATTGRPNGPAPQKGHPPMTGTSASTSPDQEPPTHEDGLSIPQHRWAAPVTARCSAEAPL